MVWFCSVCICSLTLNFFFSSSLLIYDCRRCVCLSLLRTKVTPLQLICFKLDGFIIYIKVSFVTNQSCCLFSFFGLEATWRCSPTLSSFETRLSWCGASRRASSLQGREEGKRRRGNCSSLYTCFRAAFRIICDGRRSLDVSVA